MSYAIDDLDANIVKLLQTDGRLANTEIARRLGVAEATVRKRIERLLRQGIIQIGAWADPLKIGYEIYAIIELEVDLVRIEAVGRQLARLPEIFFLAICIGRSDIHCTATFRSTRHLHEFVTKRLGRIRGIQRAFTSNITQIVKREPSSPISFADFAGENGAPPSPRRRRRG